MKNINLFGICTMLALLVLAGCKEEEVQEFDIDWPVPEITGISPEQEMIEGEVTISGNSFTKITGIWIGGVEVPEDNVVSQSETEIVVNVPRAVGAGTVELENIYNKRAISEASFTPEYPVTTLAAGPASIERGSPFRLTGENVDLITSVQIGSTTVSVDGSTGSASSVSIQTSGADLSAEMVTITVTAAKGGLEGNATFIDVPVVDPGAFFDAVDPIVLWDFEDGVNPYSGEGISSINGGDIPKGRGANYLHIEASNASTWHTYGLITAAEVNPGAEEFHDPHISFLINTGDAEGYFHMQVIQAGTTYEAHFNNAPDDYKFKTDGWEWRSYTLDPTSSEAGEWKVQGFDAMQPFTMQLEIRNGNIGTGNFEINVDQIMITDGKVDPAIELWDFEDQESDPFIVDGEASTHGYNGSSISPFQGDGYYTVQSGAVGTWKNFGKFVYSETLNLADMDDPHLSFWVNTNGAEGYFQMEDGNGSWFHFTKNAYDDDYKFVTDGWELRTIRLAAAPWEGEGFDPTAFKPTLFFKTGNVGGDFEINLDEITISDGPMF